jgi:hypothetical protein
MRIILRVMLVWFGVAPLWAQQPPTSSFDSYKQDFWQAVSAHFGDLKDEPTRSSVFATNVFLSRTMTVAFEKSQVHLEATLPNYVLVPQPSVMDLKVEKVFKNCDLCPKCDLNPLTWGACLCDAATLVVVAACTTANGLVNVFHDVTFGRASFHDVTVSASMTTSPLSIQFDPSLSNAQILGTASGSGQVGGKLDWTWTSLAGLFTACIPQTLNIPSTGVSLESSEMPMVSVIKQESTNDGLSLKLSISGGTLKAQISNPAPQIMGANPILGPTCPIGFAFLTAYAIGGQVIPIKKDFSFPTQQFDAKLASFTIPAPDRATSVPLTVVKNALAIGAVENSGPVTAH